ncbi:MAG: GTPase [Candidatus Pacearchaeota archaeon]
MGYWGVVNNSLKNSDVILLILDARIPEESRNKEVLRKANEMQKKVVFVFNKCDLISKENLNVLKEKYTDSFFISATKKDSLRRLKSYLINLGKDIKPSLRISLIGYPNVGKSSILNILAPKTRAKVSSKSGTTKKIQWIREGDLRFMDTPGVIPRSDSKIRVGITASKDAHKLKNPDKVAYEIIRVLRKQNLEIFKKFYKIDFEKKDSDYNILLKIGKKKNYVLKGGEIDENRTVTQIISDWQKGKM